MTALPTLGAEPSIQFEVIARSGATPLPGGEGAITSLGYYPAIDGSGNVVFTASGDTDSNGKAQRGLYTFINGQLQKVANTYTQIPGGGGATFTHFPATSINDIDAGRVAFTAALDPYLSQMGVYSNVGQASPNDIVEIAVEDGIEWESVRYPWVDGDTVAFTGQYLIPNIHNTIFQWNGSDFSTNFVDAGAGYGMTALTEASISGDAAIFQRYNTADFNDKEVVIASDSGHEILVSLGTTPIPGHAGTAFSRISNSPSVSQSGQDAAFTANGGAVSGAYKRTNGGALERIADTDSLIPGTDGQVFLSFSEELSLENGQVVFIASGPSFMKGVYTDVGGSLSVIVDDQNNSIIELDNQMEQVQDFDLSTKSFAYTPQGYMVVFYAFLKSRESVIIRATINVGGTANEPNIGVSGDGTFGDVNTGSSKTQTVTVSNTGTANLVLGNLNGLSSPFSMVSNNCGGATLAAGSSCTVGIRFSPTTTGQQIDTLVIPSNDPDQANANFAVSGTGTDTTGTGPNISVSGDGTFGDVNTGSSKTQTVTVSNTGTANLVIGNLYGLSTPFSIVSDICSERTLAPTGYCTVKVRFSPTTTGQRFDTLVIPLNDPDQANANFAVSGTGTDTTSTEPNISVSGDGTFGDVNTGSSKTQTVTVSNTGTANLVLGNLNGLSSPFSMVSNNCGGATLAAGSSCTVGIRFSPTTTGQQIDTLVIPSNDPDQANANFAVSGTGTDTTGTGPNISVSGDGTFGDVNTGSSKTQTVTVSNTGTANLVIGNLYGLSTPFSIVSDICSERTLAPTGYCTVKVRFSPTTTGQRFDTLVIPLNDPDQANANFAVSGTGTDTTSTEPNISVSGDGTFGDVNTGSSKTQTVTVSNTGTANLVLGNLNGLSSPFSMVSNNCGGATLAAGSSCTVGIRFSPTTTGQQIDTLVIPSNDPDQANANFAVSGTGTDTTGTGPNISVSGDGTFGDVNTGSSKTQTVTVSNTGTANLVIGNLYGLAAPFSMVSNNCSGATVAPTASCSVGVRFAPTTSGSRSDTLVIPSNDPDQASVNFGVNGTGTQLPAQEEVILDENFEDGNFNGWSTDGNVAIDGILALGNYSLRHTKSATSVLNFSTVGYSNVSVTMHLAATSLDNGESCYAEISTNGGSSWITVIQILQGNDDGSWKSGTISPVSADDNPDLQLRFRSTGAKKPDYCYGDDVTVSGTLN